MFRDNGEAVQTLRRAVIDAKEQLSFVPHTTIEVEWNAAARTGARSRGSSSRA